MSDKEASGTSGDLRLAGLILMTAQNENSDRKIDATQDSRRPLQKSLGPQCIKERSKLLVSEDCSFVLCVAK